MSQERSINNIVESLTEMLVTTAKRDDKDEVEKAIAMMEEGWAKMDEVLGNAWFNKEVAKIWRESHNTSKKT